MCETVRLDADVSIESDDKLSRMKMKDNQA